MFFNHEDDRYTKHIYLYQKFGVYHNLKSKEPWKKYTVDHFDSFIGRQLKFAVTDLMHYVKVSMETLRKEYKMFVKDPNRTLVFDNDHKFVPLNKKATSIKT